MAGLADRGVSPSVVDDQYGRLTFTAELARAIRHLLDVDGAVRHLQPEQRRTDPDLGRHRRRGVPAVCGRDPADVTRVSTAAYAAGKDLAPRPRHSTLRLDKITATGFRPEEAAPALERYLASR